MVIERRILAEFIFMACHEGKHKKCEGETHGDIADRKCVCDCHSKAVS